MDHAKNEAAIVTMREITREFSYDNTIVQTLRINYPIVKFTDNRRAQNRINSRIRSETAAFARYAGTTLYKQAVQEYIGAKINDFPFRAFETVMQYEVTMNQDCYFSTFYDRYEYTGGAHGNTTRASDSWNTRTGSLLSLPDLFKPGYPYRRRILEQILRQAEYAMQQNPNIYFQNYKELIIKNFNPESFYLIPGGICIYYQQYDIAPYSSGIIVFTVPHTFSCS